MKSKGHTNVRIVVEQGDALAIKADVLALKYVNTLYGVELADVQVLAKVAPDIQERLPKPAGFYLTPTKDAITIM